MSAEIEEEDYLGVKRTTAHMNSFTLTAKQIEEINMESAATAATFKRSRTDPSNNDNFMSSNMEPSKNLILKKADCDQDQFSDILKTQNSYQNIFKQIYMTRQESSEDTEESPAKLELGQPMFGVSSTSG